MRKTSIFILLTILSFITYGQEKIPTQLLKQDLDILKVNLETYHTGLFTYSSKTVFDHWFSSAKKEINTSTSYEFFRKINELNTIIKNGHTAFYLNPAEREQELKMPPITIYKYKNKYYLTSISSEEDKELIGSELLSINGKPFSNVFEQLLTYQKRDGNNVTQPKEELIHSFSFTYSLAFGSKDSTLLKVAKNGVDHTIKLKNITATQTESKTDQYYDKGKISFEVRDTIATLTVPTFNLSVLNKDHYKSKLKHIFRKLKQEQVKHLIIDIRYNGGGNTPAVEELLSYLYDEKFKFYKDVYQLHKKWNTNIIPSINYYPKHTANWALKKGKDDFYRSIGGTNGMKTVHPKKNVFKGKLYILTNGTSLSAAAEFASFIKQSQNCTIIGEEPGGNKVQNTSGYALQIGLPNSNIIAEIPIILWKMNVDFKNNGKGVRPDYWVRNTIDDELNGIDSLINFTYELIQKNNK